MIIPERQVMNMNILEVQNLCKTYGKGEAEVRALDHVSFSVGKGEFIAIVGESGSGKSTLLNVVGALDNPTSGKVLIDGKDIFSMPEKKLTVFRRQNIGFIFQSFYNADLFIRSRQEYDRDSRGFSYFFTDIKACPIRQRDIQQQKVILTCLEELICFHYGTGIIYQKTIFLKRVFQAFNQA